MKKIITISIQNTVFPIEEPAYATLDGYLNTIKKRFKSYPDHDEIIADIENRIAEKFSTEILTKRHKAVTENDVETLMADMGTVEDILPEAETAETEVSDEKSTQSKRFYRNNEDRMIAGVASGIAAYFNLDPTLVRLAFVISIFFGGFGILTYLILWIVVPSAKTTSQKLEMQGNSITLASLEKNIKAELDRIPEPASPIRKLLWSLTGVVLALARFVFTVIGFIVRVGLKMVAFVILLGILAAIFGVTVSFTAFGLNLHLPYIEPASQPIFQVLTGLPYWALLGSAYLIVVIPLFVILLIGVSLLRAKNLFSVQLIVALMVLLFGAGVTASLIGMKYGPQIETKVRQLQAEYNAKQTAEQIETTTMLKAFNQLDLNHNVLVTYIPAASYSATLRGSQADVDRTTLTVQDGILVVSQSEAFSRENRICIIGCSHKAVLVTVSAPNLEAIRLSHSSEIISTDAIQGETVTLELDHSSQARLPIKAKHLELNISGSSEAILNGILESLNAELNHSSHAELEASVSGKLVTNLSGSSNLEVRGSAETLEAQLDHSSRLNMRQAPVQSAVVDASGSSEVWIQVLNQLIAKAKHSSLIEYAGNPRTEISENHSGRIRHVRSFSSAEDGWESVEVEEDQTNEEKVAPIEPIEPVAPAEPNEPEKAENL